MFTPLGEAGISHLPNESTVSAALASSPVVGDAVTGMHDPGELFDVEVEQFLRELTLIAHHRRSGLQGVELGQAVAAQPWAKGVCCGLRCGPVERSRRPATPSARKRAIHLRTLRSERPTWSAAAWAVS